MYKIVGVRLGIYVVTVCLINYEKLGGEVVTAPKWLKKFLPFSYDKFYVPGILELLNEELEGGYGYKKAGVRLSKREVRAAVP